jgi:hypothetical protein
MDASGLKNGRRALKMRVVKSSENPDKSDFALF